MNSNLTPRPWGFYSVLQEYGPSVKLKELVIEPGASLSMQRHSRRQEIWFVAQGHGRVDGIDEKTDQPVLITELKTFEMLQIELGEWHQLSNPGAELLRIIEIQFGSECTEEDIERKINV